jgi:hypothetical protein
LALDAQLVHLQVFGSEVYLLGVGVSVSAGLLGELLDEGGFAHA